MAISMQAGPEELFRSMGTNVYRDAYRRGMSLSAYLETIHPQEQYRDGIDAFTRLMQAANIRTRAIPEMGVWADEFQKFNETEQHRALFPEFLARRWREVQYGKPALTRALYMGDDQVAGSFDNPYIDAQPRFDAQIAPAIPISELVAVTTPITGAAYRVTYINTGAAAGRRLVRIGESTEIPTVKLTISDKTVELYKFGRALESSYEALRTTRIDKISLHIQLMAAQAETDKLAAIMDVLVNGDGSAGSAATNFNLTTLDSGTTANNMTLRAWLAFKMKFANPYMLSTALAQEAQALDLLMLNTGSGNVPLVTIAAQSGFGGFRQINTGLRDGVGMGWTAEAPSGKIVGFDRRFAIERVTQIGADISEVERYIKSQVEVITFTEIEGFSKIDNSSVKTLNTAA